MAQDSLETFSVDIIVELLSVFQAFKFISFSYWGGIFVLGWDCKDMKATRKSIL